jgi:hypothetical protein
MLLIVRRANGRPQLHRQAGIVVGLALFLGAASLYTARVIVLAASTTRKLAVVEQSYQQHRWGAAIVQLGRLAPSIGALRGETHWMALFECVPEMGPRLRVDENALAVLQKVTMAARDLRPLATGIESKHGVMDAMRKLRPAAIVASAQGLEAIARLPSFAASSPFFRLNFIKLQLRPLLGLARVIASHPGMVSSLWGRNQPDRFLLIFQDNGELRSTGGFIAADGLMTLSHGQIGVQFNSDIAKTADAIRIHDPAPWVLRTYFGERDISFINANLNPDVPASARFIQKLYNSIPHHPHINGIIFLDSWLADRLIGVVGKVSAAGHTLTAMNFYPQVEYLAEDRGLSGRTRMRFLGEILQDLEAKMEQPGMLSHVLPVLREALTQKHLMIDADNPPLQRWLARQHWAGALPIFPRSNTLFVLNDNYGGLKDNHFMKSEVGIRLKKLPSGRYQETVTTTWTLMGIRNGWLVGTYVGWVQCYVPEGAQLISLSGYHVHGLRMALHPALEMTAFGTGIEIAPRLTSETPPHSETLQWVFLLPRLTHPRRVHVIIQPGLPGQQLEYQGAKRLVIIHQAQNEAVVVK